MVVIVVGGPDLESTFLGGFDCIEVLLLSGDA